MLIYRRLSAGKIFMSAAAALFLVAPILAKTGSGNKKQGTTTPTMLLIEDIDFFFELNDTDEDLGVQLKLGPPEPWRELMIYYPNGDPMLKMEAAQGASVELQGISDLFFESGEPNFELVSREEIIARFPAGIYKFQGESISGSALEGTAMLTHDIPDGPVITAPLEGDILSLGDDLIVMWDSVTSQDGRDGIEIESYQIIVTNEMESNFVFDERLPASETSTVVPANFFQPGIEYEVEVLAREVSGNQAISLLFFSVEG